MAVDDALLTACAAGAPGFPCVRFYEWSPATLSLGYHQDPDTAADPAALRVMGLDLVRRPTGGRAVLHDAELTYSVVAACRQGPLAGPVMTSYRRISEALALGLRRLGIAASLSSGSPPGPAGPLEPCFVRRWRCEVEAEGAKLVGSVQLQRAGALLQQGSIPLRMDGARLNRATGGVQVPALVGLEAAAGRPLQREELVSCFTAAFEESFQIVLRSGVLCGEEERQAEALEQERYGDPRWTRDTGGHAGIPVAS